MKNEQKMKIEMQRVSDLLALAVADLEAEGGDIRFFNAAFLVAAIQLQAEVEGPDTIMRALSSVGVRELTQSGIGSC